MNDLQVRERGQRAQAGNPVRWPDTVEEILGGDQAVALAYVTPASGVVLVPVTNFALQDRSSGTVTVNSSVGAWKKLERMQRNPNVSVAFHTREHGFRDRPEYVLVQGRASISSLEDRDAWLEAVGENWERFGGQPRDVGPLWDWVLRAYHWRVNIEISVERVVVWPDLACAGTPEVLGSPFPEQPPTSQPRPARGERPRLNQARAAKQLQRLPHVLLGWVGTDGLPIVVPVAITGTSEEGIVIDDVTGLVPPDGRRAGLTGHRFSQHVVGQIQHVHTGWLQAEPEGRIVYAPHTRKAYRIPAWRFAYNLGVGFGTRWRLRKGRRAGFLPG